MTFVQCVRIEPHSSSLTNVENSSSNFRQSVQICCRGEQKEEGNGNCKAFCVTRKCSKVIRAAGQEEKYALVIARCRVQYGKYRTCFSYLL